MLYLYTNDEFDIIANCFKIIHKVKVFWLPSLDTITSQLPHLFN